MIFEMNVRILVVSTAITPVSLVLVQTSSLQPLFPALDFMLVQILVALLPVRFPTASAVVLNMKYKMQDLENERKINEKCIDNKVEFVHVSSRGKPN